MAPKTPLVFREWHPGVELAEGALKIPYPVNSRELEPKAVLLPMNGWDAQGYRLGYGAGFFDRTLASLKEKPLVIGVSYEMARIADHPSATLGHPGGLRGHRARRVPARRQELAFLGVPGATSELVARVLRGRARPARGLALQARLRPSPTGTSAISTRRSRTSARLKARMASVSTDCLRGLATLPPHRVLSTAIRPPRRTSLRQRS